MGRWACAWLLLAMAFAGPASADPWDASTERDNSNGTDNELVHGAVQVHDLAAVAGVADQDWFIVWLPPYASFEVVVDGMGGDVDFGNTNIERYDTNGIYVEHADNRGGSFNAYRLAWRNATAVNVKNFIRVFGASCTTTCNANDIYTIRGRETTIGIARFNNSGSQTTVLMAQNTSGTLINAYFHFWNAAGQLILTASSAIPAKGLTVWSLPSVFPTLAGQAGSITIAHDGEYGGLNAKAVALEPATGFSFDTPGTIKP